MICLTRSDSLIFANFRGRKRHSTATDSMKFYVSRSGELNSTLRPIREDHPMSPRDASMIWWFKFMAK